MTEQAIEQAIQAAGKTAPRVTLARIESIIVGEHYFTAADGVQGNYAKKAERYSPIPVAESLCLLTFCVLELANGFTVTGESACASPENFDPEIGRKIARKIAREDARNKIWQLEGYLLKQQLHDA
ncbi:Gp49 family protein [Serratia marcescens]|uniref:Gp49 family protein n=1 Tax=Serratia marcescens TaxID=615 RepID=UPI0006698E05|nr:Gp49 family protein [Serratia marcescens]